MPSTVQLRDDYDAAQLRLLAKRSRDPRQIRRLLALAAVYDGMSRAEAARVGGMDRQMLRDWAHRFNEDGPDGLTDRPRAGRPRQLTDAQMEVLAEIVETGPDPATNGVVRWRRIDLTSSAPLESAAVYCRPDAVCTRGARQPRLTGQPSPRSERLNSGQRRHWPETPRLWLAVIRSSGQGSKSARRVPDQCNGGKQTSSIGFIKPETSRRLSVDHAAARHRSSRNAPGGEAGVR